MRSGLPRANSMFSFAKTAKDRIGRVASETRIASGANLLEKVRAKAQILTSAADGASKRAASARRPSQETQATCKNQAQAKGVVNETNMKQMCDMGFSNAAARLALEKNRGTISLACNWLLDENNRGAIETAEAADLDGIIEWFRARSVEEDGSITEKIPESPTSMGSEQAEPLRSSPLHRRSLLSDDGCGLGRFLNRESFPSPRQIPLPRRLSRCSHDSSRLSSAFSERSRESIASDGKQSDSVDFDGRSDVEESEFVCGKMGKDEPQKMMEISDSCRDQDQKSETSCESPRALVPPDSASWDWPLSRHEKKARVHMIERHIFGMEQKSLLKEVDELRGARTSNVSSMHLATRLSA